MELQCTLAVYAELDDMVNIHCAAWERAYRDFMDASFIRRKNLSRRAKWEELLQRAQSKHYILRASGEAVGMISVDRPWSEPSRPADDDAYEIFGLYIHPTHEGKGYGSAALAFSEALIRDMGYRKITLWTLEPNLHGRAFFEHRGFTQDSTEKLSYYDRPIRLLRYEKQI